MVAKKLKILPPDKGISIWLDSDIKLLIHKDRFVDEFLGNADIGVFKHPLRNTVKEEVEAIKTCRSYAYDNAKKQFDSYVGFKDDCGLYECGVLVIRHNKRTKAFCKDWWEEIQENQRDQVSFPYVLSKHNIKLKANNGDVRNHPWFKFQ